jgi:hypothetical protein
MPAQLRPARLLQPAEQRHRVADRVAWPGQRPGREHRRDVLRPGSGAQLEREVGGVHDVVRVRLARELADEEPSPLADAGVVGAAGGGVQHEHPKARAGPQVREDVGRCGHHPLQGAQRPAAEDLERHLKRPSLWQQQRRGGDPPHRLAGVGGHDHHPLALGVLKDAEQSGQRRASLGALAHPVGDVL